MIYRDRIRQQVQSLGNVPEPDDRAIEHSEKLYLRLLEECKSNKLSFAQFMQSTLYAPGLGYYSAGAHKIGPQGDFITAPEISPLFGQCIAIQAQQILGGDCNNILEFGAGSGALACSIMDYLAQVNQLPQTYYILEPSPDLKQRQQQLIETKHPSLAERFVWLDQLPDSFAGVVIANEVLDAMPVNLFTIQKDGIAEHHIDVTNEGEFNADLLSKASDELEAWWQQNRDKLSLPVGYQSEVNLAAKPWLEAIAQCVSKGLILLIDYGFPEKEYYLAERASGTLKCHYRHHHHNDPFVLLGLQDITAHVDFTAIANAGFEAGLDVLGYVNQAGFLTSCGILQLAESQVDENLKEQLLMSQQIKPLIMPEEMGELFKVMALGKQIDPVELGGLVGFRYLDQRRLL